MKLPLYITKDDKIKINQLLKDCKGEDKTLLKKIILVAAYGTMIRGKIDFQDVITQLIRYIRYDNLPLIDWWRFGSKAYHTNEKFFGIPYKLIYEQPMGIIEKEIIKLMYGEISIPSNTNNMMLVRENIKKEYQQFFKKMFAKI